MQALRFDHSATLMSNGEVLIAGGAYYYQVPNPGGGTITFTDFLTEAELYNPATGTFTVTGSMNRYRSSHVAALLPSGEVLVASGTNTATAELYDPSNGSFSFTASLNDERDSGAGAVLLDSGLVVVIGGERVYGVYRPLFWNTAEIFNATTPNFSLSATPASQTVTQGQFDEVHVDGRSIERLCRQCEFELGTATDGRERDPQHESNPQRFGNQHPDRHPDFEHDARNLPAHNHRDQREPDPLRFGQHDCKCPAQRRRLARAQLRQILCGSTGKKPY
jgi:hypothetical protein